MCTEVLDLKGVFEMDSFNKKEKMRIRKFLTISAPVVGALFLFLASGIYIVYRMVSDYNYNERWKDYDECGLG